MLPAHRSQRDQSSSFLEWILSDRPKLLIPHEEIGAILQEPRQALLRPLNLSEKRSGLVNENLRTLLVPSIPLA